MDTQLKRLLVLLSIMPLLVLAACGQPFSAGGTSPLSLHLTDAPAADASWVRVDFGRIELVPADDAGGGIIVLTEDGGTIDNVLDYQNGATTTLVEGLDIPDGTYHQIRLIVEDVQIGFGEEGDEETYDVFVPSGAQTGLKINVEPPLVALAGETSEITLDFDAANAIIETPPGSGNYLLKPTAIRAVSVAGVLEGSVVDSAGPVEGATVDVYADDGTEPLVSARTEADGSFRFITLTEGTYDLMVNADGYDARLIEGVVVDVEGTTDVGAIELTANPQ